ncbi:hypothetical protein [Actinoplanes awajinensis]|uniref:Uncharacterized protein n=1 Tax=Actinoplanes awajinensis subsp. mycoplanecinus TaxID=135947 RepID=A0A0X3VB28_9ACTN|nr:hypothetical protein [Actinoplanes awajinensis]KUL41945.1 hypothetical protein ADL15_02765 [Actinoplanes awajinensis subsp. mycoplanecinus]
MSALVGLFAVIHATLSWFLQETAPVTTLWISVAALAGLGPVVLGATTAPILFAAPFRTTTAGVTAGVIVTAAATIVLRRYAGTPERKRAVALLWVAVIALSYGASVRFATARMAGLARQVASGRPIPPAGLTLTFDVHADPVCVRDGTAEFFALYLGESDGWIAFYQPSLGSTIRRAKDGLRLAFIPPATSSTRTCG